MSNTFRGVMEKIQETNIYNLSTLRIMATTVTKEDLKLLC
jgi:hypothetical protein